MPTDLKIIKVKRLCSVLYHEPYGSYHNLQRYWCSSEIYLPLHKVLFLLQKQTVKVKQYGKQRNR